MMWFFAALVVLALGGVAVVASGSGSPMAGVRPDRPDLDLPADGPLTGADLRTVRFSTAVRGYRMDEVDALLSRLAAQLESGAPGSVGGATRADVPAEGSSPGPTELADIPSRADEFAATTTRETGSALDFTPASLVDLDELLGVWGSDGAVGTSRTIQDAGLYAGEVMVRSIRGARWTLLPELFGDLPVVETPDGAFQNPVGKAFQRAENGPEDSIAFHYEAALAAVTRHAEAGAPAPAVEDHAADTTPQAARDNGEDAPR